LRRADIVISSTGSPHYILTHDQVAKVLRDRKQKPIFFIDIAVPRDIDPSVNDIENAYLYNMDDLQQVVNQNIQDRELEARKAEAIVEEEVTKFVHWYRTLDMTPTIVALRKKFEEIRKKELEKTLSLHPNLSEKEKKSLEALTSAIINKILHEPLTLLKQGQENGAAELYLDTLQTLFGLSEKLPEKLGEENLKEIPESNDLK
jgi:glutamyl-tRNA reductase